MSDFHKLLRILEKELSYQEKLLKLLTHERAAIVKLNIEEIEKIRDEKEGLVDALVSVEKNRTDVFENLAKTYLEDEADKPKSPALSELVDFCPERDIKNRLGSLRTSLKDTAEVVKSLNDTNSELIKQTLGFIASTIAIMRSVPGSDLPTYGPKGHLQSDCEDPAFAKRIPQFSREA